MLCLLFYGHAAFFASLYIINILLYYLLQTFCAVGSAMMLMIKPLIISSCLFLLADIKKKAGAGRRQPGLLMGRGRTY